ncbi:dienelactone hydrolase family protein [Alteromonas oceani]|uniref:Dienelactone hydrolase family protein n=1 Tax=Alteromonas oceani TaxID=2071609 RepID=A0ABV7JSZ1_9ALTE|nr:dienelactone hydrolase family protein [Alteromonas oceani]
MQNIVNVFALCISLVSIATCQAQSTEQLSAVSLTSGTGKYPATAVSVTEMPQNTLFLPFRLPDDKLPVVLWGNGGCMDNALAYGAFLREIASHGYIVLAAGQPLSEGKTAIEQARAKLAGEQRSGSHQVGEPDKTTATQLLKGLTWLQEVNTQKGHPLQERINTEKVAVMGHSCGGLQAIEVATDSRLDTAIIFNSGVINEPMSVQSTALKVRHEMLDKIKIPLAYINGGPSDIAYFNAIDDFEKINHIPVLFAENGVGHGGTFRDPNGGAYARVALFWLNWQLKGEAEQGRWFNGKECLLCEDFDWQVKRKQLGE